MNAGLAAPPVDGHRQRPGIIHRTLVPLDGSPLAECALPHAVAVSRAFGSELVLLRVVGSGSPAHPGQLADPVEWRLQQLEAERYLAEVGARLAASGARVVRQTAIGKASEHILAVARAAHIDLIVLTTHGIGGLTQFRVSGTASKVLSSAECSLLLVSASRCTGARPESAVYTRVLVPLDGSKRADWAASLAAPIARASTAELLLIHVIRRPELVGEPGPQSEACCLANRLVEVNSAAARAHLEQLCATLAAPGLRVRWRVERDSSIGHVIERVAEEEAASLVVVSAHGQSPGTGCPYGAVVSTLLAYGSRPILVLQDVPQRAAVQPSGSLQEPRARGSLPEAT